MKVILFTSSSGGTGIKEIDISVTQPFNVAELLEMLGEKVDFLKPYIQKKGGKISSFRFALIRGEEILKLNDSIHDEDVIKVLPPMVGG